MLYQVIIAAVLLIFLANLILNLKNLKRPDARSRVPAGKPLISVLVPARNEEETIERCLNLYSSRTIPTLKYWCWTIIPRTAPLNWLSAWRDSISASALALL